MKKRKLFTCFLIILLLLNLFVSCNRPEGYVKYPKNYTLEYCQANYEDADDQLVAIEIAPNCIDPDRLYGILFQQHAYYAIKDVPPDEYLNRITFYTFGAKTERLVRKKQGDSKPDLLTLEYESIELYWRYPDESIVTVNGHEATSLRVHFNNCIENYDYLIGGSKVSSITKEVIETDPYGQEYTDESYLFMRIHFAKYEYIVFEAQVRRGDSDNRCYMEYRRDNDCIYLPLPEEIAKLIPET